ncbi:MAG: hypothetical protein ABI586_04040 [Candidatus Nanopelagicales bacterium]
MSYKPKFLRRLAIVGLALAGLVLPSVPAHATFSGENGRIVFRRFFDVNKTWGALFSVRPDGTGERQLTHPPRGFVDANPDVSPDGRWVTFERQGTTCSSACSYDEVYVVRSNGADLRRLTGGPAPIGRCHPFDGVCSGSPAWAPDGKHIVFRQGSGPVVIDLVERQGIAIMNAVGSHVRLLTQTASGSGYQDSDPQVSPNGRYIVFQRNNVRDTKPIGGVALWVLDRRTGRQWRITPYPMVAGDTPDWSPDGTKILFHDNLDPAPGESSNLWTVNPNGTGLHQLTFATGGAKNYLGSSWSPDGTHITVGRRPETGGLNADVMVMNADGTGIHRLTHTLAYDSYPDWGPEPADLDS